MGGKAMTPRPLRSDERAEMTSPTNERMREAIAQRDAKRGRPLTAWEQLCNLGDSVSNWEREQFRDALICLCGGVLNEMTARGLPLEWTEASNLGRAQEALGCESNQCLIELVRNYTPEERP